MRKTTTSRATFCRGFGGWLLALALAGACGKRGDPLPPLRPLPAAAEAVAIRQVGDVLRLQWRAPSRNQDGTTEKIDLREVEIRRRIIDLPALVEEQTVVVEPEPTLEEAPREEETPEALTPPVGPAEEVEEVEEAEEEVEQTKAPEPGVEVVPEGEPELEPELEEAPGDTSEEDVVAEPSAPVLQIPPFAPASRPVTTLQSVEPGESLFYSDPIDPSWIGKRVEYAVVYTNRRNRRGPRSTVVQIDPIPPLEPPGSPTVEARDGYVSIAWPPSPAEGVFYSVFRRRESAAEYPERPLHASPLSTTAFEDRSVTFGAPVCYIVKTVPPPPEPELGEPEEAPTVSEEPKAPIAAPELDAPPDVPEAPVAIVPVVPPLSNPVSYESVPSEEACLTPVDVFAPPPPTGLVALRSGEDVLLTWDELERPDVKGYRIYRSSSAEGPFTLLNEELVTVPSYTDETAAPEARYFYAVTAVDDAPAENESERSELAEVRGVLPR